MFWEKDMKSKRAERTKFIVIFICIGIIGLITAYFVQQHWHDKNRIRDNVISPAEMARTGGVQTVDTEDGEITEGNLIQTGIIVQDEAEDVLASADDADYFEITAESADGYTGCAFATKEHDLARGRYTVTISYETDSDDNYVVVYSPNEMAEDAIAGETGKELLRISLPSDQTSVTADLDLNENKFGVVMQVYYQGGDFKITRIETNEASICTDSIWNLAFLMVLLLFFYWLFCVHYTGEEKKTSRRIAAVILLAFLVSCLPFMNDFLIDGHDVTTHLGRISGIAQGLQNGQFPVWINMVQCQEFGYAAPVMYPQLFLYIPALMMCAGMSLMNAYKIFVCMLIGATLIIAYFSFKAIFHDRAAALVSAITYSLCLYHLGDIYSRAALGEVQAMCFMPLLLWGFYEIYAGNERKWPIVAIGLTGILGCHLLCFVITITFAAFYFLISLPHMIRNQFWKRFFSLVKAGILTVLLNLYFLIPFADYYFNANLAVNNTNDSDITLNGTGAYLSQVFTIFNQADSLRRNKSYGSTRHEMMLSVGVIIPLAVLLFCWIYFVEKNYYISKNAEIAGSDPSVKQSGTEKPFAMRFGVYMLVGTVVSLFMSLWIFPWTGVVSLRILDKFRMVQFTWRFLMVTDLLGSALTGCVAMLLVKRKPAYRRKLSVIILVVAFATTFYYLDSTMDNVSYYDRNLIHEQGTDNLYLNEDDPDIYLQSKGPLNVRSSVENTQITGFTRGEASVQFSYQLPEGVEEADLTVPLYQVPGYRAFVNGGEVSIQASGEFLVSIHVTEASGSVEVSFQPGASWYAAGVISLVTLAAALAYTVCRKKRRPLTEKQA